MTSRKLFLIGGLALALLGTGVVACEGAPEATPPPDVAVAPAPAPCWPS